MEPVSELPLERHVPDTAKQPLVRLTPLAKVDDAVVDEAVGAYRDARWPRGAPEEFGDRLLAARVLTQFRWLGDLYDWTATDESRGFLDELRRLAVDAHVL